ncbi:MAG TPA: FAD-binding protein, partial [Gaiellaceae bacterium]|nr:FAD-binding protein [Gaiellaceae bacterium]
MTPTLTAARNDVTALRDRLDGEVFTPADAEWDEARLAWNLAADQRPVAVVYAESAADVVAVVGYARENGLHVTTQGTGHFANTIASFDDTILLKTS